MSTRPAAKTIFAIDPGNTESAYTLINTGDHKPLEHAKLPNHDILARLYELLVTGRVDLVAIEMVASYGMPVGAEVFETCVWIGRYQQATHQTTAGTGGGVPVRLVKRQPVKLHHCHSSKAKDSNITQALIDRFAHGEPNRGKGTKAAPGWFYGFAADVWQAYALAVYVADTHTASAEAVGF